MTDGLDAELARLAELTDTVLFGDVWARPQLSPRDRSLVTVSVLIAMNRPDQLRSHLARARDGGSPRVHPFTIPRLMANAGSSQISMATVSTAKVARKISFRRSRAGFMIAS